MTLRDPVNKQHTVDYVIEVYDTAMAQDWYRALQDILQRDLYLEKNFCFLGFPDTPRNIDFICAELNRARDQINRFFANEYYIEEVYTPDLIQRPIIKSPRQEQMNRLHNHFETLQGTVWQLSDWYRRADYETKFAIRQLNNLCHEAESLMLSQRKKIELPDWVRPSQITTFLNAPRYDFPAEHKRTYHPTNYDRRFGEVYIHWTQIGKTLFEVFRDEGGVDLDQAMCDAITHLRYYSGEFDIEWAQDVCFNGPHPWHTATFDDFESWLQRNGFDPNNAEYNFGYHAVGQVNIQGSFGTTDFREVWPVLSQHLDIYRIQAGSVAATYDYNYTDEDYYQQQIEKLKPGYDYSSRR